MACTTVIRTAKAVVEEIPCAARSSVGSLAGRLENNSERDVHRISKRFKLTLEIPLTNIWIGKELIPTLRMTDWAKYLLRHHLWHRLAGLKQPDGDRCDAIWKRFWHRYQKVNPSHEIYHRPGHDLSKTCGLMLHGDEGRGLRKAPLMVIAAHSILGFGISTSTTGKKDTYIKQTLNYEQPTWTTRYLLSVLPKQYYSDEGESIWESDAFQDLMKAICEDLRQLYDHGIETPYGHYFFCVINVMGDWPFIAKCGNLARSYLNISKAESSRTEPKGICHICRADMVGVEWTDYDTYPPTWLPTVNTLCAFVAAPAALVLPKNNDFPESLFAWDLFHAWHIGCGKTFLASSLAALIMSSAYNGSVDLRCEQATKDYTDWSALTGQRCQLRRITTAKLGGLSSTSYPTGAWSKGTTTTCLTKFFWLCAQSIKTMLTMICFYGWPSVLL